MDAHSWEQTHGQQIKSQLGCDEWVLAVFGKGYTGFYVDVGAADGIVLSNTAKLEQMGWQGIAVDPLLRNFEGRHRTKLFKEALYSHAGVEVEFAVAAGDTNLSGITQELTTYKAHVMGTGPQLVRMRTRTLADVLGEAGAPQAIEYMSLDTEGSELAILSTFPFDKYHFGVISVEHNFEEPKRTSMRHLLMQHGYVQVAAVQWDDWYVHQSMQQRAAQVPLPPGAQPPPQ